MKDHTGKLVVGIPTILTGEMTSTIISHRRVKIYPTDVGELTGKQIEALTGTPTWKIINRFNKYGPVEGIFSNDRLKLEIATQVEARGPQEIGFEDGDYEAAALLGVKVRTENLKKIRPMGTWERECCR